MDDSDIERTLAASQYREAFGLLFARYREKVFRLSFSLLRNETQAEDAAQDAFLRIWKGLPTYHGGASLSTWIYTITRNTCLTEITRRGRHPTVSLQEPEWEQTSDSISSLQFAPAESGAEMDVKILLAKLPEKYRQVITLFYLEQKAYEEVASMLGMPLGTVKTLLFRAKKELLRINSRSSQPNPFQTKAVEFDSKPAPMATVINTLPPSQPLPKFNFL